jgi:hypothetical protein
VERAIDAALAADVAQPVPDLHHVGQARAIVREPGEELTNSQLSKVFFGHGNLND